MTEEYISISTLNDFIFCPYSIYLHNVYMNTDRGLYHATPQTKGEAAHEKMDEQTEKGANAGRSIMGLSVYSSELGIMGKIDLYRSDLKTLVEYKYKLSQIFRGQIYQLWGQYFCMMEMGFEVCKIEFHEISTTRVIPVALPTNADKEELICFIDRFRNYNPTDRLAINYNKCSHCIYCNLCDKTEIENVYEQGY